MPLPMPLALASLPMRPPVVLPPPMWPVVVVPPMRSALAVPPMWPTLVVPPMWPTLVVPPMVLVSSSKWSVLVPVLLLEALVSAQAVLVERGAVVALDGLGCG